MVRPPLTKAGYTNAADSVRSIQPRGSQEKENDLAQLTEESIHELVIRQQKQMVSRSALVRSSVLKTAYDSLAY